MPWKESRASEERLKFIAEVLSDDSTMTDLCRRFGISRRLDTSGRNDMRSAELQRWSTSADVLIAIRVLCQNQHGSALSKSGSNIRCGVQERFVPGYSELRRRNFGRLQARCTAPLQQPDWSGSHGNVGPCLMSSRSLQQRDRIRFGAWISRGALNAVMESAVTHSRSPMRSACSCSTARQSRI